jgi:hypothetical protein
MGDYTGSSWTFSSDGSGGAIMVDPITTVVALDASTAQATTTTHESSLVSSDLFASIADDDSLFSAFSRGSVRHAAWHAGDHDADLQFFDAPGHTGWQGLLEFPSVFAATDPGPLLALAMPFTDAASLSSALVSDQFRFTDTNAGWHGSNSHTVDLLSQAAAQVAPDPAPGNPHDDQSDSLPQTAALNQSSNNDGPRGEAFGFGQSEGRNANAEDQNINFDGPPGQALAHALETGRESHGDDSAGQSSTHEAANGHHHSEGTDAGTDESGPRSIELASQFVPPGQAAEHMLETGRGSQSDDGQSSAHEANNGHHHAGGTDTSTDGSGPRSIELASEFVPPGQAADHGLGSQRDNNAGASASHEATNGHLHAGGTDTGTDGSGPQSIELPIQFALHTQAHNSPPGLSGSADSSPVSHAHSNGPFDKTGLLLDSTADQFHFPDVQTGGADSSHIHIPQPNGGAHGNTLQTLIDAAAPPDHLLTAAATDASLPGGMQQADPAVVHAHHGMA